MQRVNTSNKQPDKNTVFIQTLLGFLGEKAAFSF